MREAGKGFGPPQPSKDSGSSSGKEPTQSTPKASFGGATGQGTTTTAPNPVGTMADRKLQMLYTCNICDTRNLIVVSPYPS